MRVINWGILILICLGCDVLVESDALEVQGLTKPTDASTMRFGVSSHSFQAGAFSFSLSICKDLKLHLSY